MFVNIAPQIYVISPLFGFGHMNKSLLRSTLALSVIAAMSSATQANEQSATVQNNVTKLETIVVTTAGGFEQNIADAPASISVISAEKKIVYRCH